MFKHLYSRFFASNPDLLHFAAHSHYFWPDVTREAHLQYWEDSAKFIDSKWQNVFENVIPQAQHHIANRLNTGQPEQIVFAPNTHEFVCRLLSCFSANSPIRILTTDSEFYSFDRQVKRMEEVGAVEAEWIPTQPFDTFEERFCDRVGSSDFDLIFTSSVFFNSGLGLSGLRHLVQLAKTTSATLVIDGYHSYCALPLDLADIKDEIFFLGGGYKYAQSGEGVCFMHVPRGANLTPINTGWFAEFGELSDRTDDQVRFAKNGQRFAGATFDPSGIYRFNAVMDLLDRNQLNQAAIHAYVQKLQARFLNCLDQIDHPLINHSTLLDSQELQRGHFFAFETLKADEAGAFAQLIRQNQVVCDVRSSRIRFGFGLYQDEGDVDELVRRIRETII